jgi:hypothetical protein
MDVNYNYLPIWLKIKAQKVTMYCNHIQITKC